MTHVEPPGALTARVRLPYRYVRFTFHPVEELVRAPSVSALARRLRTDRRNVYRWRARGLTVNRADVLAVRLDLHPVNIWPDEWSAS